MGPGPSVVGQVTSQSSKIAVKIKGNVCSVLDCSSKWWTWGVGAMVIERRSANTRHSHKLISIANDVISLDVILTQPPSCLLFRIFAHLLFDTMRLYTGPSDCELFPRALIELRSFGVLENYVMRR